LWISATRHFVGAGIQIEKEVVISAPGGVATEVGLDLPMRVTGGDEQIWWVPANASLQTLQNGTIELVSSRLRFEMGLGTTVDLRGQISGAGGLSTSGDGTLVLRGANTFQGSFIANFTTKIDVRDPHGLGVADGTAANGTFVSGGAVIHLPDGTLPSEAFNLEGAMWAASGADTVVTGPIGGGGGLASHTPGSLRIEGVISGFAPTILQGTVIFASVNTYTGYTGFADGSTANLVIDTDEAMPQGGGLLSIPQTARLTVRRRRQTASSLQGHGTIALESTPNPGERATLLLSTLNSNHSFDGTFTGEGDIRFRGHLEQINTNSPNLTGTLTVDEGRLWLNGTLPVPIGVASAGELGLDQIATGPVTSSGRVVLQSAAASTTGLTITGGVVQVQHLGGVSGGAGFGKVTVSGPVALAGTLDLTIWSYQTIQMGDIFTIVDKTSPGPVTGAFEHLPEGGKLLTGPYTFRVSYVGGDGNDVTLTVLRTRPRYLLSEGATSSFFTTEIAVANASENAGELARVDFYPVGGQKVSKLLTFAPLSRITVRVNDIPELAGAEFSTEVHSLTGDPLIVERTMTWDAATGYGAHTEHAADELSTTWYFAEGAQGFFKTFLLLANPQDVENVATVQYLRQDDTPIVRTYPLAPRSRFTIDIGLDAELVNRSFGTIVTFQHEGMAERAMYFGMSPLFSGGHESAGVTAPSTTWFVPEGATGSFFETFILLANPGDDAVDAALDFLPQDGAPIAHSVSIPAKGRTTVNIESVHPSLANAAVATQVTSPSPIVVERAQYWPDPAPAWYEAHNSFGVTQPAKKWGLAEGRVGMARGYHTYILIANPGDAEAYVAIRYLREAGKTPLNSAHGVPPRGRITLAFEPGGDVGGLRDEAFGALITSQQPIAVERAMYSTGPGQPLWAAGTSATAVRIP
jgi:autotransporter-associated beta strand protein